MTNENLEPKTEPAVETTASQVRVVARNPDGTPSAVEIKFNSEHEVRFEPVDDVAAREVIINMIADKAASTLDGFQGPFAEMFGDWDEERWKKVEQAARSEKAISRGGTIWDDLLDVAMFIGEHGPKLLGLIK